ncbi:MAG: alcohol dehydrogenase catalytic domain-containing protein [Candidatus Brocadiales bacterium]|nr:alcohol dehydrogenase catalytic domain-containing protein [Candidatus Bathyanammoxibius sp.]
MRALVYKEKPQAVKDFPVPQRREDEALIRVLKAGICSTDLEITRGYMSFSGVMGHEFAGVVEDAADKKWIGKRVAGEINCPCRRCGYCKKGLGNHCPNRTVLGIAGRDGAFADYLTLPVNNLHELPQGVDDTKAVFVEPLAAAFRILEQLQQFPPIKEGEKAAMGPDTEVAVLGDGRLGLLVAQVLSLTGCRLLALGRHPEKLDILSKIGGIKTAVTGEPLEAAGNNRFDYVVDCTGSPSGLETAIKLTRPMGTIILKSTFSHKKAESIDLTPIVVKEISLIGSRCGPFPKAIEALEKGEIHVGPLISKVYRLDDGVEALKLASKKGILKVVLDMNDER